MDTHIRSVIEVDAERCVNCHACISVCPVKYCMDGSGDVIEINHELCIGCGRCVAACTHGARRIKDDLDSFLAACARSEPIVAIAAPSIASAFPDRYLQLNGYLTSLGVQAVFDVGFGAELTVRSYADHIDREKPRTVIAQPCAAIVSYIELYRPELVPFLAPCDSPMLHTMKMIREYFPEYRDHRIAAISPCVAKRREFDETGLGDFNVTFASLRARIEADGVRLSRYEPVPYAGPEAERGVLFPTPGGLSRTYHREDAGVAGATRRIEGTPGVYEYLASLPESIRNGTAPLLVDCLSCEKGCNGGPGTGSADRHVDALEKPVELRAAGQRARYDSGRKTGRIRKLTRTIDRFWKPGLYRREYRTAEGAVRLSTPNEQELAEIYRSMLKEGRSDLYNCSACGYGSCRAMAVAIFNGLNKPENCHYYQKKLIDLANRRLTRTTFELDGQIRDAVEALGRIKSSVTAGGESCADQFSAIEESSASITQMIGSIRRISDVAVERRSTVTELVKIAESGRIELEHSIGAVNEVSALAAQISGIVQLIDDIASRTNILSINASIEASHAGTAGRGFSVVANEIRRLSEEAAKNSRLISERVAAIMKGVADTAEISERTGTSIRAVIGRIGEVAESLTGLVGSMQELSSGSEQIMSALSELRHIASEFKDSYGLVSDSMEFIHGSMSRISAISERTAAQAGSERPTVPGSDRQPA